MLGLTFLGETRNEERWVIADVKLKENVVSENVSTPADLLKF